MILPNNGKVIIIDDQPEDVKELISALSKEKVPFVHYKEEDLSDLPDSPIENVRLIFLDLELVTDTYVSDKNITSPIKTRLMRVIKPNTAYALVIWSKKHGDYRKVLLDDFENEFSAYRPIFHTSLPKADIIGRTDAMSVIKTELKNEIEKFKSFNAFLTWESIVNESAGKLTNDLSSLYPPDLEWDNKTKYLLYKLALAYSGKAVNKFSEGKQLKNALYTLTMTFTDSIESAISKLNENDFNGLITHEKKEIPNFTTVINKLLLISESSDDLRQPGNLFFSIENIDEVIVNLEKDFKVKVDNLNEMAEDQRGKAKEAVDKKYKDKLRLINEEKGGLVKLFNRITCDSLDEDSLKNEERRTEILNSKLCIEINITPLCDYAQEKAIKFRLLPGVIIKSKFREYITKSLFTYISDADFRIRDTDYFFLFDFRTLYSVKEDRLKGMSSMYRIKQQLLSDIQIKLGAHVNRAGVAYVS